MQHQHRAQSHMELTSELHIEQIRDYTHGYNQEMLISVQCTKWELSFQQVIDFVAALFSYV